MAIAFGNEHVNTAGSYMHIFSEIILLGAYHMMDKISILLNVMNSSLYYSNLPKIDMDIAISVQGLQLAMQFICISADPL